MSVNDDILAPKGMDRVFLLPGDLCVTREPLFMATLLGSCVAVCIYNTHNGSAAMNHYLRGRSPGQGEAPGKFGDTSTAYLIKSLFSVDAQPAHYEAKVFGGGAVVGHLGMGDGIGEENIRVAREVLAHYGITIVDEDVGGKHGRKVYFNSQTREVKIRPIGARHRDYSERKIRVLIVDDSGLVRKILRDIIHSAPEFEVCGEAADAFEARDMILEEDPDVLSLDIIMPRLDGLEFLEKIMKYKPIPTVIVSTIAKANSPVERRAKKIGAVAVVDKDALALYTGIEKAKGMYLPALKAASMSIL